MLWVVQWRLGLGLKAPPLIVPCSCPCCRLCCTLWLADVLSYFPSAVAPPTILASPCRFAPSSPLGKQSPAANSSWPAANSTPNPCCVPPAPLQAYVAWLGFYNSARGMGWSKPELVARANGFAAIMGLAQPPALMKKTVGMMVGGCCEAGRNCGRWATAWARPGRAGSQRARGPNPWPVPDWAQVPA